MDDYSTTQYFVFMSSSIVTISYGRSNSTTAYSVYFASLALLYTSNTSFSTHFGSKGIILFYAVRLWFLFLVATLIYSFAVCCYKDDLSLTLAFIYSSSVYFMYVLVQISYYKDSLCRSWTISISQFSEIARIISNEWFTKYY